MDINSVHLANSWLWALWIYFPVLLWAILRAPWKILLQKDSSNIVFASCAIIFLFWHLKVHIEDGLSIHLLGSTILTLMFRWQVALMCNAAILAGITLTSSADLQAFGMNGLLTGVAPVAISHWLWRFNERFMPANYFIYIFLAGFFGAAISMMTTGLIAYQVLSQLNNQLMEETLDQYLLILIPITYPEAFITGAIISIFVIYKPQWIATFDDRRYLHKK